MKGGLTLENDNEFSFESSFRLRGHQRLFGAIGLVLGLGGLALVAWATGATAEQVQQWVAFIVTGGAAGFGVGRVYESRQSRQAAVVAGDERRGGESPAGQERAQPRPGSLGDSSAEGPDRSPEG